MQLLLLLLLLSSQGGGLKEIQPLLEGIGGEDIKAEAIAEVLNLVNILATRQPEAEITPYAGINEENTPPFSAISAFADPEIIGALEKYLDG